MNPYCYQISIFMKKLWEEENKKILKDSIEALNYSILSEIVDRYEQALTAIELKITDLEENSLNESNRDTLESLDILSRQLIVFRRHFWLVRDVLISWYTLRRTRMR